MVCAMNSAYIHMPAQMNCCYSHSGEAGLVNSPVNHFSRTLNFSPNTESQEHDMAKNHYSTKPKRRNRSGKRKDTPRIAANMAKIKELERKQGRTA